MRRHAEDLSPPEPGTSVTASKPCASSFRSRAPFKSLLRRESSRSTAGGGCPSRTHWLGSALRTSFVSWGEPPRELRPRHQRVLDQRAERVRVVIVLKEGGERALVHRVARTHDVKRPRGPGELVGRVVAVRRLLVRIRDEVRGVVGRARHRTVAELGGNDWILRRETPEVRSEEDP